MITCSKCKIEKNMNEFHVDRGTKNGLSSKCKLCKREYGKLYQKTDKVIAYYSNDNYKERKLKYDRAKINKDPRVVMYRNTKTRAKRSNIPFNLDIEDLIIPEYCPILEIKLLTTPYGDRRGFHMNSPSIDKINPELGYVKGNVQVISMKANAMKYSATKEELILFCNNILKQINDRTINS